MTKMIYHKVKYAHLNPIDLFADLKLTCDAGTIDIKADGKRIFIRMPSLLASFKILRMFAPRDDFSNILKAADQVLKRVDVTLFWQNRHFGILGSKANPILWRALIGIQAISKLWSFGANPRRTSS